MTVRGRKLWYFALPLSLMAACVLQAAPVSAQVTSTGFDCSRVQGLLKQDNMAAGRLLIECGIVQGGRPAAPGDAPPSAPNIRVSNRKCTDAASCTKSENMVGVSTKDGGQTIVVNYNDHIPNVTDGGTSFSTDGGATFHEIHPPPFATGHGDNLGDPIVVFNSKLNKWFAGDLVGSFTKSSDCAADFGDDGIGLWTSKDGKTWTPGACAHIGNGFGEISDDRESMWVDNDPTSGTFGRMYISWNDFANNSGALSVTHSDDGTTWSAPVIINPNFMRNAQITGSPRGAARFEGTNSAVFVSAMDESSDGLGGCTNPGSTRQNVIYKSLDGGLTWTSHILAERFKPACDDTCSSNGYFARVNPIWRAMGWSEPGVGPKGVVHYAYAGGGKNGDHGDIFYQRSTDNGETWSKPIKLNTDPDKPFKTQWMPSLSVDLKGKVTVSWYDRRKATSACNVVSDPGCNYERVGRQSKNNGASFLPEFAISNGVIPQPDQQDPFVQSCYAGDYDYDTALNGNAFVTWTDGRRSVKGTHVQDVDFAKVPLP